MKQALILTDLSEAALAQAMAAVKMLNLQEVGLTLGFIREPQTSRGGVLMRVGDVLKEQAEKELKVFAARLPEARLMVDRWRVFNQEIRSGSFDLVVQTSGQNAGTTPGLPKHILEQWGVPVLSFPSESPLAAASNI